MTHLARVPSGVIAFPADWILHHGVELATAYPPDLGARYRYYERWQPQPSFAAIVERVLASDPELRVHQVGEAVRVVTTEGEYGAWVAVEGRREGKEAMRFIGAVFLDHFAAVLDCVAVIPAHFAQLRQQSFDLLRNATFHLVGRQRPFFYVPPVGWQPIVAGAATTWYPLDFPKHLATIAIPHAAVMIDLDPDTAIAGAFAEAGAGLELESSTRDAFTSAGGIAGSYLQLHGTRTGAGRIYRELAMFVVAPYAYRFRLETADPDRLAETRELFRAVAGSFRPLPTFEETRLGRAFTRPINAFDHWAS